MYKEGVQEGCKRRVCNEGVRGVLFVYKRRRGGRGGGREEEVVEEGNKNGRQDFDHLVLEKPLHTLWNSANLLLLFCNLKNTMCSMWM